MHGIWMSNSPLFWFQSLKPSVKNSSLEQTFVIKAVSWGWIVSFERNLRICQWYSFLNYVLFLKQISKLIWRMSLLLIYSLTLIWKNNEIYSTLQSSNMLCYNALTLTNTNIHNFKLVCIYLHMYIFCLSWGCKHIKNI